MTIEIWQQLQWVGGAQWVTAAHWMRCYNHAGFHSDSIAFWSGMFQFSPCKHDLHRLRSLQRGHTDECSVYSILHYNKLQRRNGLHFVKELVFKQYHRISLTVNCWPLYYCITLDRLGIIYSRYWSSYNNFLKNFKCSQLTFIWSVYTGIIIIYNHSTFDYLHWLQTFLDNFPTHRHIFSTIY